MIFDSLTLLSGSVSSTTNVLSGQSITTGTILSTNTMDLGPQRGVGEGEALSFIFSVRTSFSGMTAVEMQIIAADDAALSSNVSVLVTSGAVPVAQLVQGAQFALRLPPLLRGVSANKRYLGARYVVTGSGTGTMTCAAGNAYDGGMKVAAYAG